MFDEITAQINDLADKKWVLEFITKLNKEVGVSILYTSHKLEEIEELCDEIGIILF